MFHRNEGLAFLVYGFIPISFSFAVQFIALRIRDSRASPQDPHLGRKSLLYLFVNLSVFLLLFGLTMSALDWSEYAFEPAVKAQENRQKGIDDPAAAMPFGQPPRDWFNDQQRNAAALVTSGLLYTVLFCCVIRFATNDREFPAVRRAFAGARLALAGLIVMISTTVTIVAVFQQGETDLETIQKTLAINMIWGPVVLLHLVLLLRSKGWRKAQAVVAE